MLQWCSTTYAPTTGRVFSHTGIIIILSNNIHKKISTSIAPTSTKGEFSAPNVLLEFQQDRPEQWYGLFQGGYSWKLTDTCRVKFSAFSQKTHKSIQVIEKRKNDTGIRSGLGYRVWTNTELSALCYTKLALRWFSCAVDGLQNFSWTYPSKLNFPPKLNFFLKTKLFFASRRKK